MSNYNEIQKACSDIDKTTGNIDDCLRLIKSSIAKRIPGLHDLYVSYKQYWILVYECSLELDNLADVMIIPAKDRTRHVLSTCINKPKKFEKRVKLFSVSEVIEFVEEQDNQYMKLIEALGKLPEFYDQIQDSILKKIANSKDGQELIKSSVKITKIPDHDYIRAVSLQDLQVVLALSHPSIISSILSIYNDKARGFYYENHIRNLYHDLGQALIDKRYDSIEEILEYTVTLDNLQIILHILRRYNLDFTSKANFYAAKNALIEYMAPPCISAKKAPYEMDDCLALMRNEELLDMKKFIFSKMLSLDTQNLMGKKIQKLGVDCFMELELSEFKLKHIANLQEELQIELLHAKNIESAIEVVGTHHRMKSSKNV